MTEGSIVKNILFFAIPLILGNLLQQLYNTADSIIVGNFVGKNALAAVGSSTSVIYLLIAFSQGASVGAGVVVSQYLGARKKKETEDAVHTALAISVILGVILTIGGVLFSRRLLLWMHTPEEVFDGAVLYLQIYSGGLLFNVLYNMAAGILNAGGNSKRSLIYLAYASVTNIILDLVLIRGFGMGVEGAAIATDISQVVSSVLATGYLMRVKADYRVSLRKIKIHRQMAGRIVKIGLPTGIQNMVISLSNILVQSSVNGFGADAVAGFGAYLKIDGFNILPVMSISMAVTTFTGQNYGAKDEGRCKKIFRLGMLCSVISCGILSTIFVVFRSFFIGLFTSDPSVYHYAQLRFLIVLTFECLTSSYEISGGCLRGFGRSMTPAILTVFGSCVLRLIWLATVCNWFHDYKLLMAIYPISWVLTGTMVLVAYFRTRKKLFL